MNNLQWEALAKAFYAFKYIAEKMNFYVPELKEMEKSLFNCRPYNV